MPGRRSGNYWGFRVSWWAANCLLLIATATLVHAFLREYSLRRYLQGFSDAVVPAISTPEQKVEAILTWMRNEQSRSAGAMVADLSTRDPEVTLRYDQLLRICGTATNAFLNLSRSAGLRARRLLLLTLDHSAKHVVAEVLLNGKWIVVDPAYGIMMRDSHGQLLTREDLRDSRLLEQATSVVPGYPSSYTYERYVHVRLGRVPVVGANLRPILNRVFPKWEEKVDWSLLLERESFFILFVSALATIFCLLLRMLLAWYADHRLNISRFHLREHIVRA